MHGSGKEDHGLDIVYYSAQNTSKREEQYRNWQHQKQNIKQQENFYTNTFTQKQTKNKTFWTNNYLINFKTNVRKNQRQQEVNNGQPKSTENQLLAKKNKRKYKNHTLRGKLISKYFVRKPEKRPLRAEWGISLLVWCDNSQLKFKWTLIARRLLEISLFQSCHYVLLNETLFHFSFHKHFLSVKF